MRKPILAALTTALILSTASTQTSAREIDEQLSFDAEGSYYYFHSNNHFGRKNNNLLELRLTPTFNINDEWAIKARLVGEWNIDDGDTDFNGDLGYIFVETNYDRYNFKAGRILLQTQADRNPVSGSMVAEDAFKGVQASTDFELESGADVEVTFNAGKLHDPTYIGAEAVYDSNENLKGGIGYHYMKKDDFKANILALGAGYSLNDDWNLYGAYAHNSKAYSKKSAYNLEAAYLGADPDEANTWGAFVAYRYLGGGVYGNKEHDIFNFASGLKGINVGGTWSPVENSLVKLSYMHGKSVAGGSDSHNIFFARASYFF